MPQKTIKIHQPSVWKAHYRNKHYILPGVNKESRIDTLRGYNEIKYRDEDIWFHWGEIDALIDSKAVSLTSELSDMINAADFLPTNRSPPRMMRDMSVPQGIVEFPIQGENRYVECRWSDELMIWYAVKRSQEKCGHCDFRGTMYSDAGLLGNYGSRKVIEAFGINEGILELAEVERLKPVLLKEIARHQGDVIEVRFESEGSLGRYPGPSGGSLYVPVKGKLPEVPQSIIDDPKWEIRFRHVDERGGNIAYAYKLELWGFEDSEDFYEGPFDPAVPARNGERVQK